MKEAREVIEGLMEIAEVAMPDSYFESDSRTRAAREWLDRDAHQAAERQAAPINPAYRSDLDEEGWPKRWSDPAYLGDGPWGA